MRASLLISSLALVAGFTGGCGSGSKPAAAPAAVPKQAKVRITQFYAAQKMVPRGMKGNLCYGVENATKVELNPPSGDVWPSPARCFEVSPKAKTTYTLTAIGEDGSHDTKTLDLQVGAPAPRLYDLWVNSIDVAKGSEVKVCFKTENARSVKAGPGKLDGTGKCLIDHPSKSTTYKITALGGDEEIDSGTVSVKVH